MRNLRELSPAFHKGLCEDYHSVLAGLVLGVPFRVRQPNPIGMFPPPVIEKSIKGFIPGINTNQQLIDGRPGKPIRPRKKSLSFQDISDPFSI
jgi:hypothetical protein